MFVQRHHCCFPNSHRIYSIDWKHPHAKRMTSSYSFVYEFKFISYHYHLFCAFSSSGVSSNVLSSTKILTIVQFQSWHEYN
jgi:hypothetical protein